MFNCWSMHLNYRFKLGVSHDHGVLICFASLVAVQAKNNVRSSPAGSALTIVSDWSHKAHTTNCHLDAKGEKNGVQWWTKVSFGRTMMRALELLWLVKRHISGQNDIEQWRNQGCSYSPYWVTLVWVALISQSVGRSKLKILINKNLLKVRKQGWSPDWITDWIPTRINSTSNSV